MKRNNESTGRTMAFLSMLASAAFNKGTRRNPVPHAKLQQTPEQVAAARTRANQRRERKAAFRLNQANETNYRIRQEAA